jgi:hypothetical protein
LYLLCLHRNRPSCRATKEGDELPSLHSFPRFQDDAEASIMPPGGSR